MRNKAPILPFFLHYMGCPGQCIYCNQSLLNGSRRALTPEKVRHILNNLPAELKRSPFRIGYYGASFTFLPSSLQESFLNIIPEYSIRGLIVSTRPEGIQRKTISKLKKYNLQRVELGVQSLDSTVLRICRRTYTQKDVHESLRILSELNVERSVHIMAGLPEQTEETILQDVQTLIRWGITHIRIHPVIVLKDTVLADMYQAGVYNPWPLERAVSVCSKIMTICRKHNITVLRLGVQPSPTLEKKGNIIAGPYHPSFGEMCHSYYYRNEIERYLKRHGQGDFRICFPDRIRSKVIGPQKMNQLYFQKKFPESRFFFETMPVRELQINGGIIS